MTSTSQHIIQAQADDDAVLTEAKLRPLALARRLHAATTITAKRDYLREISSPYADDADDIADAAFTGGLRNALASLADAYERELNAHAAHAANVARLTRQAQPQPFSRDDEVSYGGELPEFALSVGTVTAMRQDASGDWIATVEFPTGYGPALVQDIPASELRRA